MKIFFMFRIVATLAVAFFFGCVTAKLAETKIDDRIPRLRAKQKIYRVLVEEQLDQQGLWVDKVSIGDSALFSCLALVGGAASFNPSILFTKDGKPIRHPDIYLKRDSKTPISRDMVTGILWCLMEMDHEEARMLISKTISYGKSHPAKLFGNEIGWAFCDKQDRELFKISEEDFVGRCVMPPTTIRNIYKTAEWLGVPCDETCQKYKLLGYEHASDLRSYHRHLAVLNAMRNGIIDGGVKDSVQKNVLQKAADSNSKNALYLAANAKFSDGDMSRAIDALLDNSVCPEDRLPTKMDRCNNYAFSRERIDDFEVVANSSGCLTYFDEQKNQVGECGHKPNEKVKIRSFSPDWLPCPDSKLPDRGYGVECLFAMAVVLNELPNAMLDVVDYD
jgi:hypothetical protein